MSALVAVEFRRLLARRAPKALVLFAVAGIALAAVLVFVNSNPNPETFEVGFEATELLTGANGGRGILSVVAVAWLLLVFIVAATLVGAEWRAGTMSVLLTWEPRRPIVMAAKMLVAAIAGAVIVAFLQLLLVGALWPSAALRGTTAAVDGDFWQELISVLLRTALAGGLVALVGFSLASLGRNTSAALGGGFLYFAVVENVLRAARPGWKDWFFTNNVADLLGGDSSGRAVAVLLGYVAALVVITGAWFLARDVA